MTTTAPSGGFPPTGRGDGRGGGLSRPERDEVADLGRRLLDRADRQLHDALPARSTGLPRDSVANVSRLVTLDRSALTERVGRLPEASLELVLVGIDVVLGQAQSVEIGTAVRRSPRR